MIYHQQFCNSTIPLMKHSLAQSLKKVALYAGTALAVAAPSQGAVVVNLNPAASFIGVSGTVDIDLMISGLTAPGSLSLGSWIADISYDGLIVSLGSVTFGNQLDFGAGSIQSFDTSTAGLLKVDETSLEDTLTLNALQAGSFMMARLTFTGVSAGTTSLAFDFLQLSDETGLIALELEPDFIATGATITVGGGGTGVPDSGTTLSLFGLSFAAVLLSRRRCW